MVLTKTAMEELRSLACLSPKLRFHCSKKKMEQRSTWPLRLTVDNITGKAVVQYLSGQMDVQPAARLVWLICQNGKWRFKVSRCLPKVGPKNGSYNAAKWGDGFDQARYDHPAWVSRSYHWTLEHRWYGHRRPKLITWTRTWLLLASGVVLQTVIYKGLYGIDRFFLKEIKNVMFLNKIDVPYCLVVFFVVCPRLRPFWSVFGELALFCCSTAKRKTR